MVCKLCLEWLESETLGHLTETGHQVLNKLRGSVMPGGGDDDDVYSLFRVFDLLYDK